MNDENEIIFLEEKEEISAGLFEKAKRPDVHELKASFVLWDLQSFSALRIVDR